MHESLYPDWLGSYCPLYLGHITINSPRTGGYCLHTVVGILISNRVESDGTHSAMSSQIWKTVSYEVKIRSIWRPYISTCPNFFWGTGLFQGRVMYVPTLNATRVSYLPQWTATFATKHGSGNISITASKKKAFWFVTGDASSCSDWLYLVRLRSIVIISIMIVSR